MKTIFKISILATLLGFLSLFSLRVSAWRTIYGISEITISDIEDPFLLELLFPIEDAPLLSDPVIDTLLSDEFYVPSFMNSMNGYLDGDHYGSSQLYGDIQFYRYNGANNFYTIEFSSALPDAYKIALIFEDGTILSSSIITQTKMNATIIFDGVDLSFSESDSIYPSITLYERDFEYYFGTILHATLFFLVMMIAELLIAFHFGYKGKKTLVLITGIYTLYYLLSTLLQWTREETMFDPFSFYLPYIIIMTVILLTVIQSAVWAIRFPHQSQVKVWIYVILGNATLIALSIPGFYASAGLF